jgi:hypothetical protein
MEANLLAALAHRELGDQRAATAAAECALALAEADRLVLPFAVTGSLELLKAISRHKTASGDPLHFAGVDLRSTLQNPQVRPDPAPATPTLAAGR